MKINTKISRYNNSSRNGAGTKYIVIHWVGAVSTAKNNADYFNGGDRQASAHFFVDDKEIWQSVSVGRASWHCGGGRQSNKGGTYLGKCTNSNSIGIEMCCKKKDGKLYITDKTIANTGELVRYLMKKYNIPQSRVIRHFDVNGKYCLPLDATEVLTKEGWQWLGDIAVGDYIAQYTPVSDSIEFQPVLGMVDPYEAEVLKNRYLEATGDHRMYLRPNSINSSKFREMSWVDALSGSKTHIIKNGANYYGNGLDLSDDELRLLVWIQGDGHYMKDNNNNIHGVEFHLKKERKIIVIQELLNSLDIKYTVSNKSDGSKSIRVYGKDLYNWAEEWLTNKMFNYNLLEMTQEQFEIFWDELMIVDGNVTKQLYCSIPQQNLDVIQALCATKGVRTNKCTLGTDETVAIMRNKSNYSVGGNIKSKIIERRTTMVSCVTVPSGFILIRQNGKTFIVGNCPQPYCTDATWKALKAKLVNGSTTITTTTITTTKTSKLTVDGSFGSATIKRTQKLLGTTQDGVVSNQPSKYKQYLPAATSAWQFKSSGYKGGSSMVKKLQKLVGVKQTGYCDKNTVIALQKFLNKAKFSCGSADGYMGKKTVKAWQNYLNSKS